MKKILLVITFLSFGFSFSQAKEKAVKNALMDFKTAYNNSDYEAIFKLFNDDMKLKFPLKKIEKYYGRINKAKGDIKTLDLKKSNGASHVYKAKFKRDILDIVIGLDDNELINNLVVKRPKRNYNRN